MLGEDILPAMSAEPSSIGAEEENGHEPVPDHIRELANAFRTGNKDYVAIKVAEEIPTTDAIELFFALGKEDSMRLAEILDDMYTNVGDMGEGFFNTDDESQEVVSAGDFVDGAAEFEAEEDLV